MTDAQRQLRQALRAHLSDLENGRDAASDSDLEERIEATRQLLEWLEQALEIERRASRQRSRVAEAALYSGVL